MARGDNRLEEIYDELTDVMSNLSYVIEREKATGGDFDRLELCQEIVNSLKRCNMDAHDDEGREEPYNRVYHILQNYGVGRA